MRAPSSGFWRATAAVALVAAGIGISPASNASSAPRHPAPSAAAVPTAHCGPGSRPETSIQGRAPAKDFASGRAAKGYLCNTRQVGHFGETGGFKVLRYVDRKGHVCAFYDTTRLFPTDLATNVFTGLGVYVLDMSKPRHPRHTATLSTPAMLSPHESLLLNAKRGLLVADMGYPTFNPGFVDVYDVSRNCLHPTLASSTPMGVLGHESAFAPDGKTFYVTSSGGQTVTAVDLTDPKTPKLLTVLVGNYIHGARLSDDGNYLYAADQGLPGLDIFDVSEIQDRKPNPQFKLVSRLSWPNASIPQVPIPMTIHSHHYLLEVDEFAGKQMQLAFPPTYNAEHHVGAARIINIDDVKHPYVVSNIRLAVNQLKARKGPEQQDPGGSFALGGYTGHYCSVPREVDPGIVACSFLLSGERVFNVTDPKHPREVAYFNRPAGGSAFYGGAAAFSQAAWDLHRHQIWYVDGTSGFWAFKVTNDVWPRNL